MTEDTANSSTNSGAGPTPIHPATQAFTLPGGRIGVLIIHGYGGSLGDYRVFAQRLHDAGYSVMGMRLAGHGQDLETLRRTSVADMQRSVRDAVEAFRSQVDRLYIFSSSFGAVLALDYAVQQHHVDGLILVNAAMSYRGAGIFQGLALRIMRLFTPYYKKHLTVAEAEQGREVGSLPAWPIDGILATAQFTQQGVIPRLSSVMVPTLIVQSQDDPVVGTKGTGLLMQNLGSVDKHVVTLKTSTHRPLRHPQALEELISRTVAFLKAGVAGT